MRQWETATERPVVDKRTELFRLRFLRTILSQLLAVVLAVPTLYVTAGRDSAVGFLCGAAIGIVPQMFFALRMDRAARQGAARAARLGMAAEAGKFILGAAGFALVFALVKPAQPLLVFVGFVVVWVIQLWEAARLLRQAPRP